MRSRHYLSYDQIGQWIDGISGELRAEHFDAIVGIERGGVFPALCAALATGAPLHWLQYSRPSQSASWRGAAPAPAGKILLCEDVAGGGHTLERSLQFVSASVQSVKVLTVISDDLSRLIPDWSLYRPGVQTVFPWERHDQSPSHQADWQAGGSLGTCAMRRDHEYRLVGVDLDGVLCEDMPSASYEHDLASCLRARDALDLAPFAPSLHPQRHVLITGRPVDDRERTHAWLAIHGMNGIRVCHRESLDSTLEGAVAHKGSTADRLGCSDFVESCPAQAALLASRHPQLRVWWWNRGQPLLLSASRAVPTSVL